MYQGKNVEKNALKNIDNLIENAYKLRIKDFCSKMDRILSPVVKSYTPSTYTTSLPFFVEKVNLDEKTAKWFYEPVAVRNALIGQYIPVKFKKALKERIVNYVSQRALRKIDTEIKRLNEQGADETYDFYAVMENKLNPVLYSYVKKPNKDEREVLDGFVNNKASEFILSYDTIREIFESTNIPVEFKKELRVRILNGLKEYTEWRETYVLKQIELIDNRIGRSEITSYRQWALELEEIVKPLSSKTIIPKGESTHFSHPMVRPGVITQDIMHFPEFKPSSNMHADITDYDIVKKPVDYVLTCLTSELAESIEECPTLASFLVKAPGRKIGVRLLDSVRFAQQKIRPTPKEDLEEHLIK